MFESVERGITKKIDMAFQSKLILLIARFSKNIA